MIEIFEKELVENGFLKENGEFKKKIQVIKDDFLNVRVRLYQPRQTIWLLIELDRIDGFFPEGVYYRGRVRDILFLRTLLTNLEYKPD